MYCLLSSEEVGSSLFCQKVMWDNPSYHQDCWFRYGVVGRHRITKTLYTQELLQL